MHSPSFETDPTPLPPNEPASINNRRKPRSSPLFDLEKKHVLLKNERFAMARSMDASKGEFAC